MAVIFAAALVIALFAAVSIAVSTGHIDMGRVLAEPVMSPLRTMMTSLVENLEELYGYIYRYDKIKAENEELHARIAQLEDDYREYTEISQENERLRALLGFNARHSSQNFQMEPIRITSWTASNFASSFTANRGTAAGIEVGDCVITADGYLVGRVTQAAPGSCTVVTLLDTTTSLGVALRETEANGILQGEFTLFQAGRLKLVYLGGDANVIIGDTVLTSGRGGSIPAGLTVGYVESLAENAPGNDFFAVVKPAADMTGVTDLYVITDYLSN